jgi:hypothetical protein
MLNELLKSALVLVISFALKYGLAAIGVEIDPVLFNTIVTAIVVWILAQFGMEAAYRFMPRTFIRK